MSILIVDELFMYILGYSKCEKCRGYVKRKYAVKRRWNWEADYYTDYYHPHCHRKAYPKEYKGKRRNK